MVQIARAWRCLSTMDRHSAGGCADGDEIETGLRLAQQNFGQTLTLSGPPEFQVAAARVAEEIWLNVEFDAPALNRAMHDHRNALDAQAEAQRLQERGVNLGDSRVSIYHDWQRGSVSCVH